MAADLTGQTLGNYVLTKKMGSGNFATVYLANEKGSDTPVALKVLNQEWANNERVIQLLRDEFENVFGLNHPNIVRVDHFEERFKPHYFIAMEYVDGGSLWNFLETRGATIEADDTLVHDNPDHTRFHDDTNQASSRTELLKHRSRFFEPLDPRLISGILQDVCAALDYAHKHKVIHLDLKPHNILLSSAGVVKLGDFGIAQLRGSANRNYLAGTPEYMSPEQARSNTTFSPAADIYALGILLYLMFTGVLPFTGKPSEVINMQLHESPLPPSRVGWDLPPGMENIILRCLAKTPTDRFADAPELYKHISQLVTPTALNALFVKAQAPSTKSEDLPVFCPRCNYSFPNTDTSLTCEACFNKFSRALSDKERAAIEAEGAKLIRDLHMKTDEIERILGFQYENVLLPHLIAQSDEATAHSAALLKNCETHIRNSIRRVNPEPAQKLLRAIKQDLRLVELWHSQAVNHFVIGRSFKEDREKRTKKLVRYAYLLIGIYNQILGVQAHE